MNLIGEVKREEKKEEIRRTYKGAGGSSPAASVEVLVAIQAQAADTGSFKGISGAIIIAALAAMLAQASNVWLGLAKP